MFVHVENLGVTIEMEHGISGEIAEAALEQQLFDGEKLFLYSDIRIVEKASNKQLKALEFDLLGDHCTVNFVVSMLGGKGGFGSNLRSSKAKGSSSKTYYRDLKTGVTVGDLERLKKAKELLEEHGKISKQETEIKKEKLAKSIEYYQGLLDSKNKNHLTEENQKLLEDVDEILQEMKDNMSIALFSDDEISSEEDDYDDEYATAEGSSKVPSYKHFFD
ncbi:uncharacterized protein KQ657_002134 [Scheffersomyces spartinae]|uniref:SDE2-like domain-containing protein n=1 Tax=Scheffersomyces spartinae TaxID=45513 RepID=A0A9P8AKC5_9ASCO|nr:uncharacterized protein KQ657_002134 [Scheffersomyces spartinae]KAG7195751.1 hypothetical protein KQ657_002134 [Scheffersomyces spartinae]